jgi:hypothetical protein
MPFSKYNYKLMKIVMLEDFCKNQKRKEKSISKLLFMEMVRLMEKKIKKVNLEHFISSRFGLYLVYL